MQQCANEFSPGFKNAGRAEADICCSETLKTIDREYLIPMKLPSKIIRRHRRLIYYKCQ